MILCESSVIEILDTLRKAAPVADVGDAKSPQAKLANTQSDYYECDNKSDNKNRGQRCQECMSCCYFNFLTQYTQKNNDALVQCKFFDFLNLFHFLFFC
jgi:hypothetical protein